MKIVILANNDVGLFKFRKELLEELIKRGHDVCVSVPEGEFIEDIKAIGCKVEQNRFLDRRGTNPFQDIKLLWYYDRMVKRLQPEIVLTYTVKPNVYGGIICTKKKVPYIANITGLGTAIENGGILQKIIQFLYKLGLKEARKVFFQNQENQEYMLKHYLVKGAYDVIPGSGVNINQYPYEDYPAEEKKLIFSTIGRIMKDKGIDEVISAARVMKKEYPEIRFRLVGSFDEAYEKKVKLAEKEGIIEYIHQQKDIQPIIKESHAILHASYHEGMSNVLLEGAAMGRPLLATNIPGCREIFREGISGIGFKRADAEDLVRVLREFINLPYEKKAEMGKAGRKRIEQYFDRNIVVKKYMNEIDKILEEQTNGYGAL